MWARKDATEVERDYAACCCTDFYCCRLLQWSRSTSRGVRFASSFKTDPLPTFGPLSTPTVPSSQGTGHSPAAGWRLPESAGRPRTYLWRQRAAQAHRADRRAGRQFVPRSRLHSPSSTCLRKRPEHGSSSRRTLQWFPSQTVSATSHQSPRLLLPFRPPAPTPPPP